MNRAVARAIGCLNDLVEDVFSCLLDPDYVHQLYGFERRLHKQKNRCLRSIHDIEMLSARERCAHVLEVVLDVAAIRRRVSDHTTFSIVASELGNILSALNASFVQIKRQALNKEQEFIDEHWLTQAISTFEDMYFSVVNVAAREPLVFLLFIDSLKTLKELLADCLAMDEWLV